MTADERLQAIEQRAKALKWAYRLTFIIGLRERGFAIGDGATSEHHFKRTNDGFQAAERLLALHEPGAAAWVWQREEGDDEQSI